MKAALRALLMVMWLAAAQAQPLDLRYQPVTGGTISSIREVGAVSKDRALPQGASQAPVGVPTDVEQGTPVGAAIYLPLGRDSDKNWRFGAAGTAEMQAQFARNAYEVMVVMDDGERRVFKPRDPGRFRVGQRVSVRAGELEPLGKDGS